MSARTVIATFGGIRPMADKLRHRSHTTVQGWWDRETIPSARLREVLDAAASHGLAVTADDLITAASGTAHEARAA